MLELCKDQPEGTEKTLIIFFSSTHLFGVSPVQGDSGGPLMTKSNTQWVQGGVVSFGTGCGLRGFPGVYTRVSMYESWIKSQISSNQPGFVDPTNTSASVSGDVRLVSLSVAILSFLPLFFSLFVLS